MKRTYLLPPDCEAILRSEGWGRSGTRWGADHFSPLNWAVYEKKKASFDALVARGLFLDDCQSPLGLPPLALAYRTWPEVVPDLLAAGANPMVKDTRGATLLHHACSKPENDVQALLAMGLDPNAQSSTGSTPLMESCWTAPVHVPLLLAHGADPFPMDEKGSCALSQLIAGWLEDPHSPYRQHWTDALRCLVERGAADGKKLYCNVEWGQEMLSCALASRSLQAALPEGIPHPKTRM